MECLVIHDFILDWSSYAAKYNLDSNMDPIRHFVGTWLETLPVVDEVFDVKFYLEKNEDVKNSEINPLLHYLLHGQHENRLPNTYLQDSIKINRKMELALYEKLIREIFSYTFYKNQNPDLDSSYFTSDESYLQHYIKHGRFEQRVPHPFCFQKEMVKYHTADQFYEWINLLSAGKPLYSCSLSWKYLTSSFKIKKSENIKIFVYFSKACNNLSIENDEEFCLLISLLVKDSKINTINQLIEKITQWELSDFSESFSLFFDKEYFESQKGVKYKNQLEAFKAWYKEDSNDGLIPTPLFHALYYKNNYQDLQNNNLFIHYLMNGYTEGRFPNAFFSKTDITYCEWLQNIIDNKNINPYLDIHGLHSKITTYNCIPYKAYSKLVSLFNEKPFLTLNELNTFFTLLSPYLINNNFDGSLLSLLDGLDTWINSGCKFNFSYFFNKKLISGSTSLDVDSQLELFQYYYRNTEEKTFLTSFIFDENFYKYKHLDLKGFQGNLFLHYVFHGQYENRMPNPLIDPLWIVDNYIDKNIKNINGIEWYFQQESLEIPVKPSPAMGAILNLTFKKEDFTSRIEQLIFYCQKNKLFDFSENSTILEMIAKAAIIEPQLKVTDVSRPFTLSPFNSDYYFYIKHLPSIIRKQDILIFRDHLHWGGTDEILSLVYNILKKKSRNIKIISTDGRKHENNLLKKLSIDENDVIYIGDIYKGGETLDNNILIEIAYDIILGSSAKDVYNINSGLLWKTIKKYGAILSKHTNLYGYLFCDDKDEFGNIDGYPTQFLIQTLSYLEKSFFDSDFLLTSMKNKLLHVSEVSKKMVLLPSPMTYSPPSQVYITKLTHKKINKIAWAGRLDSQKRPDILKSIAKRLPHITFYVWGKSIINTKDYNLESEPNIKMMGIFDKIKESDIPNCDLFLYTSEWDGVPTILLKVLELNIPIVASNVGGVSEALPTISLVNNIEDIDEYVRKINLFKQKNTLNKFFYEIKRIAEQRSYENFCNLLLNIK